MIITTESFNAHILSAKTAPVVSGDQAVEIIMSLERELRTSRNAVGLAAPQIGLPFSVAIIRYSGVCINLINPVIISLEQSFTSQSEGCLSIINKKFDVERFKIVRIKNNILRSCPVSSISIEDDFNNKPFYPNFPPTGLHLVPVESVYVFDNPWEDHGGVVSIAIQHEIDHLEGITLDKKDKSVETVLSSFDNVGRNDPCPCGSGLKFKKCCITKIRTNS